MTKRSTLFGMVVLALTLLLASSSVASADDDSGRLLTAWLTGAAEVPEPGDSNGEGQAWIILLPEQGQVCFTLTVERVASGGCVGADRQLIRAILQHPSAYYVNVHNAPFPAGALRGQLHPLND
jgi:hypothetical protein